MSSLNIQFSQLIPLPLHNYPSWWTVVYYESCMGRHWLFTERLGTQFPKGPLSKPVLQQDEEELLVDIGYEVLFATDLPTARDLVSKIPKRVLTCFFLLYLNFLDDFRKKIINLCH